MFYNLMLVIQHHCATVLNLIPMSVKEHRTEELWG